MKKINIIFLAVYMLNAPSNDSIDSNSNKQDITQYIFRNIMNDSYIDLDLKTKVFYEELLDSENIFNQAIVLLQDYLVFQALITKFENDKDEEYGIIYQEIKKQIKHFLKINETELSNFTIKSIPINNTNKDLIEKLNDPNINIKSFCKILKIIFNTFEPDDLKNIFKTFASEDIKFEIVTYLSRNKNSKYPAILNYTGNYRYELIIDIKDSSLRKKEEEIYRRNNEKYQNLISRSAVLTNEETNEYDLFKERQEIYKKEQKARETGLTEEGHFFNATTERLEKEQEKEPKDKHVKNEPLKIHVQETLPSNVNDIDLEIKNSINFLKDSAKGY